MTEIKLAILDKDGTLTTPASGDKWVIDPRDQMLLPGTAEQLDRWAAAGWTFAIASNQGGVAAGHKPLENAQREMAYCLNLHPLLRDIPAYFCPDFKGRDCWRVALKTPEFIGDKDFDARRAITWEVEGDQWVADTISGLINPSQVVGECRKPGAGMLLFARYELAQVTATTTTLPKTVMVGDMDADRDAAQAAGVPFIDADAFRAGEGLDAT